MTITSFQMFVVFPTEELKFLTFFEGTPWGRELNSGGGGELDRVRFVCLVREASENPVWRLKLTVSYTSSFLYELNKN